MARFSSKPKSTFARIKHVEDMAHTYHQQRNTSRMYFGPSVAALRKKRSAAAKKAAATRKRNRQATVQPFVTTVDNSYLEDLRKGLHKDWRTAEADKPVILSCDEVIAATKGNNDLVRSACVGHATDFVEYVWSECPAVYFDELLKRLTQRLAVNGLSYGAVIRNQAQALSSSLANRR